MTKYFDMKIYQNYIFFNLDERLLIVCFLGAYILIGEVSKLPLVGEWIALPSKFLEYFYKVALLYNCLIFYFLFFMELGLGVNIGDISSFDTSI